MTESEKKICEISAILQKSEIPNDEKCAAYRKLCELIADNKLSLIIKWNIFCMLEHEAFLSDIYDELDFNLRQAYACIYYEILNLLPSPCKNSIVFQFLNNVSFEKQPVVIVTRQMLGIGHAPTRRVLDYAYTIQEKLGIPVIIINESGLHIAPCNYVNGSVKFNFIENYSKGLTFVYKDTSFVFYQNPTYMPNLQSISDMVNAIAAVKPRMVLSVGGACITGDLCSAFTKSLSSACNTRLAIGMSEYLVLWREARESDFCLFDALPENTKVLTSVFNYIMPDNNLEQYSRLDFGLKDDAFLIIIVGNRLDDETDCAFMMMLDNVLSEADNIYVMFLGPMDSGEKLIYGLRNKTKFMFPGAKKDGSQVIKIANLLIQPERKGGARAAFEAMYYGIPVITTAYGDTRDVAGDAFTVVNYKEMHDRILKFYSDKKFYEKMSNIALTRGKKLENMEDTFKDIFKDLEIPLN